MDNWTKDRNRAIENGEYRTATLFGQYSVRNFPMLKNTKRARPNEIDDNLFFEEGTLDMLEERKRKMRMFRKYFRP